MTIITPDTNRVTFGTGPNSVDLFISEDAYLGDAQFTVSVDGQQIGGVQTATASHAGGLSQEFTALGDFGAGPHTVSVSFLNDAYGGTPQTDRNLYVDAVIQNDIQSDGGALFSNGTLVIPPATGNEVVVSDTASLNAAIDRADALLGGQLIISFAGYITLTAALDAVNLHPGVSLVINGDHGTLDGAGQFRGFFAYAGNLQINDLMITNTVALGGAGAGSAGGGAGLGGALFVAGTNPGLASGANVTLYNVNIRENSAIGGAAGGSGGTFGGHFGADGNGGGGGGLGGNGGGYNVSGGGGGGIGGAGGSATGGSPGIIVGAPGGGMGAPYLSPQNPMAPLPGGANGGGGGGGQYFGFDGGGGGGVGGADATNSEGSLANNRAGDGGFGGGGGGGYYTGTGGNGGFGGGGGSSGGNGGFGGGGAYGSTSAGFGGGVGGTPGDREGTGLSLYEAGGGLGAGGAIFVQQGGTLTIEGGMIALNTVAGGLGSVSDFGDASPAIRNGLGLGSGIFLQGNQVLNLSEPAGNGLYVGNVIADQTGSGGTGANAGAGSVAVTGPGTAALFANNTYSGGTTISGGTLVLTAPHAAGTGPISVIGDAPMRLVLTVDALPDGATFANPVLGFGPSGTLDVQGLGYDSALSSAVVSGGYLVVTGIGGTDRIPMPDVPDQTTYLVASEGPTGSRVFAPSQVIGTGPDAFTLDMSEDAYLGNAQFTVSVNGQQIGGVQTVAASHAAGQVQPFTFEGDFGTGSYAVTVNFLHDAYGGTPDTDRNLYVGSIIRDGKVAAFGGALYSEGSQTTLVPNVSGLPPDTTIGSGPDSITLTVSEDYYLGDALFRVSVDGVPIDETGTVTALHKWGEAQSFDVRGNFGSGPHVVSVSFVNDAYGGSPSTDRNLYVESITNAGLVTQLHAALYDGQPQVFFAPVAAANLTGSNIDGPPTGLAILNGTVGDDTITAHGGGNTIDGGGRGNDIVAGGEAGGDTITVGNVANALNAFKDNIGISGAGNFVTASDEAVTVSGSASGSILHLGNGDDTVTLDGAGNSADVGLGTKVLSLTGGDASVSIGPTNPPRGGNSPPFLAYVDTVTVSGLHNSVSASFTNGRHLIPGQVEIDGGNGYGSFILGDGPSTVHTGGAYNTIIFQGSGDIVAGSGYDSVGGAGSGTVKLAGEHNSVFTTTGTLSVTGGDGAGMFELGVDPTTGSGTANIVTDGLGNTFNVRGDKATIDAGSGSDTVSLYGGNSSLIFHGSGNMLFVHPYPPFTAGTSSAQSVVSDQSADLQVYVDPVAAMLDFASLGNAAVLHLLGSAIYATGDQAFAALTPDGAGGSFLPIDHGSVHFAAGIALHAGNFAVT